jgi:putative Mn2+ efflux pump MntP
MTVIDLLFLAVALSMDAFAVSICKGLASKEGHIKTGLVCGIWFGFFQALMPALGWLLGSSVAEYVNKYSAYIAFVLLAFLGIKMIVEAAKEYIEAKNSAAEGICSCCPKDEKNASLGFKVMLVFAIATSIDALAAGLSFAAMEANILIAVSFIGVTTFLFSFVGSALGAKIGGKFQYKAEIAGGVILLAIGAKILIEHLIELFA